MRESATSGDRFSPILYAAQFFFGGWFLFHGLNWWLHYFPERSFAPNARGLIPELIRSGLFDLVKALEVAIGSALLADLLVPLAVVAAVPITLVIAWVNVAKGDAFGLCVAGVIVALNALMAVGRIDLYRSMLVFHAGPPSLRGLRAAPARAHQDHAMARLLPGRHALAILLGVAVPATITYASIHFARPAPATPPR